jgi:hypothetical protein
MYKLGKRSHKKHWGLLFGIVILLLGGGVYVLMFFHPQATATIQNATAVTKHYDGGSAAKVHFTEGDFSFDLPQSWKLVTHQAVTYNSWTFQGTAGDDAHRIIMIYEDAIPLSQAVNRVLVVDNQNNSLSHSNSVSDNCLNYTSPAQQSAPEAIRTKIVTDKWENVNFLCDIGNYLRNVTGTSSVQGINTISLTGKTAGTHKFFFTFTDATISPDYSPLYNMLDSFTLK